jgi:pyruvate,water dikinase
VLIQLREATPQNAGAKAATLGQLAKAGFPVPAGFVVPVDTYLSVVGPLDIPTVLSHHGPDEVRRLIETQPLPPELLSQLTEALTSLGDLPVAVRSSATTEDTTHSSAAGQHDTYLAVHGPSAVTAKLLSTWSSLWSPRATTYRRTFPSSTAPAIAVLIQRHVDAEVAGVLFTAGSSNSSDPGAGEVSVIEASWGLGESVVQGLVTPDEYVVGADGVLGLRSGDKRTRIDRGSGGPVTTEVPDDARRRSCLSDDQLARLTRLGQDVADYLGGPQDIEFGIENDQLWLLQARPITAPLALDRQDAASGGTRAHVPVEANPSGFVPLPANQNSPILRGAAASPGIAAGSARIVNGPEDFDKVVAGDILVCRFTDPAWTALFSVIAGVVTEIGGRLSHAAIVARERRIPAVLGIPSVLTSVQDGEQLTVDGSAGTVRSHRLPQ